MARSTVVVRFVGDTKALSKSLGAAETKLQRFGKLAGAAMGIAVVGGAVASVKAFADFDAKLNESLAIMGDVSDAMRGEMSDAARKVAKTTKFSATEAAESYFFLASAGFDAKQSVAALPQVAAFAQAGMFDMATATDLATDAQSALGLAVKDPAKNLENLTRVTDVFVKANTLANTSVEQISEAMTNKAGASMRAVGMEIEEGSAVLAAFADQGVKGAEAGTQFSIVLRDLQTKALSNADAFKKAGVQVFDSNGEFRNMADIMSDLEKRLDGMSDAQKKAELSTLGFSDKSMGSLQTLLGTSDAIREYEKELKDAGGTVKDVADKQMETFNAQLGLLKDRVIDVAIQVGSKLVPILLRLGDWLGRNKPVLIGLAAVVGTTLVAAFTAWAVSAAAAAAATLAAAAPILAIGAAIAALVAGIIWAYKNWDIFRESVDAVASFLTGTVWPAIQAVTMWLAARLGPAVAAVAQWITGTLIPATQAIVSWLATRLAPIVQANVRILTGTLIPAVQAVAGWFTGTLIPAIQRVIEWHRNMLSTVRTVVSGIVERFTAMVSFVRQIPGRIRAAASGMFSGIVTAAREAVDAVLRQIGRMLGPIDNVAGKLGGLASKAANVVGKIPGFAGGVRNFSGGLALVGEGGPELVNLPRGSDVFSASATRQMISGGRQSPVSGLAASTAAPVQMIFQVPASTDQAAVGRTVVEAIAAYERRNGNGWRR